MITQYAQIARRILKRVRRPIFTSAAAFEYVTERMPDETISVRSSVAYEILQQQRATFNNQK